MCAEFNGGLVTVGIGRTEEHATPTAFEEFADVFEKILGRNRKYEKKSEGQHGFMATSGDKIIRRSEQSIERQKRAWSFSSIMGLQASANRVSTLISCLAILFGLPGQFESNAGRQESPSFWKLSLSSRKNWSFPRTEPGEANAPQLLPEHMFSGTPLREVKERRPSKRRRAWKLNEASIHDFRRNDHR